MLLSATKCPYDETECPQRVQIHEEFKQALKYAAANKIDRIFLTSSEARCPKNNPSECIRYQRYMNIINHIKTNDR